jgi:hypothetical protein
VRRGFFAHLSDIFKSRSAAAERRAVHRFSGQRWCDATERQMLDSFIATTYGVSKF